MISCASLSGGNSMLQGFSFFTKLKEDVEEKMTRKAKKPSLKKDIVNHSVLWAFTPAATLISAFFLTYYDIIGEDKNQYIILKWFCCYLVGSVVVAFLYTCWYHLIAQKEPKISFKNKFIRFFLFISSAAWTPVLIHTLDEMEILNFNEAVWKFISSFFLSSLLSLGVLGYDYIGKKMSKR